ncbi:MAG: RDD family protein, partial [Pseudonocardiaceae bacterium]
MSIWYYTDAERQQQGPLSTDELKRFLQREVIALDTLVWRDGMLHWRPLGELAEQLKLLVVAQPVAEAPGPPKIVPPPPPPSVVEAEPLAADIVAPTHGRAVFQLGSEPSELQPQALADVRRHAGQALDNFESHNPYRPSQATLRSPRPAARNEDVVYAGFWKRAAAAIVDSI